MFKLDFRYYWLSNYTVVNFCKALRAARKMFVLFCCSLKWRHLKTIGSCGKKRQACNAQWYIVFHKNETTRNERQMPKYHSVSNLIPDLIRNDTTPRNGSHLRRKLKCAWMCASRRQQPLTRSLTRSLARSLARLLARSIDPSICRSIAPSSWRIMSEVWFSNYRYAGKLFTRFDVRLKLLRN